MQNQLLARGRFEILRNIRRTLSPQPNRGDDHEHESHLRRLLLELMMRTSPLPIHAGCPAIRSSSKLRRRS